ncbi:hypothetical protein PMAYCL1PPCAC_23801, partial [Pristionchus mayeri]
SKAFFKFSRKCLTCAKNYSAISLYRIGLISIVGKIMKSYEEEKTDFVDQISRSALCEVRL